MELFLLKKLFLLVKIIKFFFFLFLIIQKVKIFKIFPKFFSFTIFDFIIVIISYHFSFYMVVEYWYFNETDDLYHYKIKIDYEEDLKRYSKRIQNENYEMIYVKKKAFTLKASI